MARPRQIRIGPHRWRVLWSLKGVESLLEPGDTAGGACDTETSTIAVEPLPASPVAERQVLVHELLHACCSFADVQVSLRTEEQLVAAISGPLLGVLRDNPALVKYLTER